VREHIARISTEGTLDRELGDDGLRTRLRAIRDEAREDAARRELEELKREMLPPAMVPPVVPVTDEAEAQLSVS